MFEISQEDQEAWAVVLAASAARRAAKEKLLKELRAAEAEEAAKAEMREWCKKGLTLPWHLPRSCFPVCSPRE